MAKSSLPNRVKPPLDIAEHALENARQIVLNSSSPRRQGVFRIAPKLFPAIADIIGIAEKHGLDKIEIVNRGIAIFLNAMFPGIQI